MRKEQAAEYWRALEAMDELLDGSQETSKDEADDETHSRIFGPLSVAIAEAKKRLVDTTAEEGEPK